MIHHLLPNPSDTIAWISTQRYLSFAQLWILTVLAYHLTSHYFSQFLELLNK